MTINNYKEQYDQLISYRLLNKLEKSKEESGKVETHHILPRSCGGKDEPENLVNLYAKEHFMAHYYLWKMHENDEFKYQTLNAFWMMCVMSSASQERTYQEYVKMSIEYQEAKIQFAKYLSKLIPKKVTGDKNGQFGKHWYYNPLTNESHRYVGGQQPIGWILGRRYKDKDAFVKAVSKANQQKAQQIVGKVIRIYNPSTDEEKFIDKSLPIPNGFERRGKPMSSEAKQHLHEYYEKQNIEVIAPKRIEELRPQYAYYLQNGWKKFKEHYNYPYSQANFVQACKQYLPEYKSNQGRKL